MSFIINTGIEDSYFSPDFAPVIRKLAHLQESYDTAKSSALLTRMEIIGLGEEQKQIYRQRSPEARFINQGYRDNEWSDDVIYKNTKAYNFKKHLLSREVDIWSDLAEACSPTQLFELASADTQDTTTVYQAAMLVKKTGKAPSKNQIIGHKQGNTNDSFVFYSTLKAEKRRLEKAQEESENRPRTKLNQESESLPSQKLNPEPEIKPDHDGLLNLVLAGISSSDTPLRKKCPLINNIDKPASSEKIKDEVETTSSVTSSQTTDASVIKGDVVDVSSIDSVVIPDAASCSFADFYKFVESFTRDNYKKQLSPEDKQHLDRANSVINRFFRLN